MSKRNKNKFKKNIFKSKNLLIHDRLSLKKYH